MARQKDYLQVYLPMTMVAQVAQVTINDFFSLVLLKKSQDKNSTSSIVLLFSLVSLKITR